MREIESVCVSLCICVNVCSVCVHLFVGVCFSEYMCNVYMYLCVE